tara:strand:- start:524 stop:628 length:105 start_codon:yes stop_codon:yes gene_type:complete
VVEQAELVVELVVVELEATENLRVQLEALIPFHL